MKNDNTTKKKLYIKELYYYIILYNVCCIVVYLQIGKSNPSKIILHNNTPTIFYTLV